MKWRRMELGACFKGSDVLSWCEDGMKKERKKDKTGEIYLVIFNEQGRSLENYRRAAGDWQKKMEKIKEFEKKKKEKEKRWIWSAHRF